MNFETPPQDEGLSNKVKKAVALGGIAAAALAGEACSPEKADNTSKQVSHEQKATVHPETAKSRLRESFELRNKQARHESTPLLDNMKTLAKAGGLSKLDLSNNNFLKYYYQGLTGARNQSILGEAQQMRVLEIV